MPTGGGQQRGWTAVLPPPPARERWLWEPSVAPDGKGTGSWIQLNKEGRRGYPESAFPREQCSERHGVFSDLEKICTSYVIWKPNVKSKKKKST